MLRLMLMVSDGHVQISPSLLAADFANFGRQVQGGGGAGIPEGATAGLGKSGREAWQDVRLKMLDQEQGALL